jgi:antitoxin PrlF
VKRNQHLKIQVLIDENYAMTKLTSKGRITLPKPLRDRLGLKAGTQIDFSLNVSGEIVLTPAKKPLLNHAQTYRAALLAVSDTADKRFSTTDDLMRFLRG